MAMDVRSVNLNLLPILRALLKHGSVSRAARDVGLSQSATSNALNRLRALFRDQLLVQVGREMKLTPRARKLLPTLEVVSTGISELLFEEQFVPSKSERNYIIATPDYMTLLLGPPIVSTLQVLSPRSSVRFTNVPADVRKQLTAGTVDVAIIVWIEELLRGLSSKRGYHDRLVGVVGKHHPFATRPPSTRAVLFTHPHIRMDDHSDCYGVFPSDDLILRTIRSMLGPIQVSPSNLVIQSLLAATSNCVAVVPKALATYIADLMPLAVFEIPDLDTTLDTALVWTPSREADPAHRWFRGLLAKLMRQLFDQEVARGVIEGRTSSKAKTSTRS